MAKGREVKVAFVGDVSSLKRATADADRSLSNFGGSIDRFDKKAGMAFAAVGASAVIAGGAIVAFGKQSLDVYADTETQLKRVQKVFGASAKKVEDFSKKSASTLAIPRREALRAAGAFGSMFAQLGIGEDQATDMSLALLQAGGDLAAFSGGDVTQILSDMGSAFRGEYDALQKYLPTISDAAIKQQALAMTGKANASALTDQEKAMAAFALMTAQSNPAMGAAAANMGTTAMNAATMGAKIDDMKAKMAEAFGPFMNTVVFPALNAFADWFGGWWEDNGEDFKKGIDEAKAKFQEMRDSSVIASNDMKNGIAIVITEFNKLTGMGSTDPNENRAGLSDLSDNWNLMMQDWRNGLAELSEKWDLFTQDLAAGMETVGWHMDTTWGAIEDKFNAVKDVLLGIRDVIADIVRITPLGGTMSFIENALGIDIPGFDTGGVVPGPVGKPRLAVVHGGETVVPTHKPGVTVNQTVNADGLTPGQAVQLITAYERMALAGVA